MTGRDGSVAERLAPLKIRGVTFDWLRRVYVMGVVNVTPDSFYDGGRYAKAEDAVGHALALVEEGADILDIGGESTRPRGPYGEGAQGLSADEELARVIPVIEAVRRNSEAPISIDTYKAAVAREALKAGADIINDVSGLQMDPEMPAVAAQTGAPAIVNHMKGTPQNMQKDPHYDDLIGEIYSFFEQAKDALAKAGVAGNKIVLDPGLGFGKKYVGNLEIIRNLRRFAPLGCPILAGPSRKSFVGHFAGGLPPGERLEGSIAAAVLCALYGANMVRVHDVRATVRALRLTEAFIHQTEEGDRLNG